MATEWSALPMRLKSSGIDRVFRLGGSLGRSPASPRQSRGAVVGAAGFTLLELLISLAIIGLIVGVVSVSVGRLSRAAETRAALSGVVNALAVARVEAMRTSRSLRVVIEFGSDHLLIEQEGSDQQRRYRVRGLMLKGPHGRPETKALAVFDTMGRTRERVWHIEEASLKAGNQASGAEAVRIWRIEFDPVSGAPVLRSPGEPGLVPGNHGHRINTEARR